jgi:drug/metabolite transporter (DMT)-like permease
LPKSLGIVFCFGIQIGLLCQARTCPMPLKALLLVVLAGLLQAVSNVVIKESQRKVAFMAIAASVSLAFYFPLFLWMHQEVPINLWSWIGIIACGATGAIYYVFVGGAYDRGDLSVIFPVIRGFGPIFILIFALILLGEQISFLGLLGILIAVFGSYVIHLPSFKFSDLSVPFTALGSKSFLYSMAAGACTATYSLINKKNLEAVDPLTLLYLIFVFMVLFLFVFLLAKNESSEIKEEARANKRNLLFIGILTFLGSLLVLYALQISKVSYLGAARNVSIVFGVLLGSLFLKEGYGRIRFVASLLIFGGVFLICVS